MNEASMASTTSVGSMDHSRAHLAAIVDSAHDGIISMDLNGVIQSWNPGAARIFGYSSKEALGRPITMLIPLDRQDEEHEILGRTRQGQRVDHFETVRLHKDGHAITISLTVSPIRNAAGLIIGASKIARDITAEKRAEQVLRETSERLRMAQDVARVGIFDWDIAANRHVWSDELLKLYGLTSDNFAGTYAAWKQRLHPEDAAHADAVIERALTTGEYKHEFRVIMPDGGVRWLHTRAQVMYEGTGRPVRLLGASVDITERKQAEEALRRSEEELRILTDTVPALISYVDRDLRYRFNNLAYENWFGCRREDVKGRHMREVLGETAFEAIRPSAEKALAGEAVRFETWADYRDGGRRYIDASYLPRRNQHGEVEGFFVLVSDLTVRKQMEDALRKSEARFRRLYDANVVGMVHARFDGHIEDANDEFLRIVGCTRDDLAAGCVNWQTFTAPGDLEKGLRAQEQLIFEGRHEPFEKQYIRRDGSRVPVLVGTALADGESGFALVADLSRLKKTEEALRASEERFRSLAEGMPHLVWEVDPEGARLYDNKARRDYTGREHDTSDRLDWLQDYHPDDRERLLAEWKKCQRSGGEHVYDTEARIRRHDGAYRWFRIKGAPIRNSAGEILKWVGTCTDVDDQVQIQEALRESEERFRTLADNIAQFAWVADENGSIFWYNQRWFDYTGTTFEEMQGWGWQKVHHPDHAQRVVEKISRCFKTGEVWEDTFPLRGRDGNYRWFLSRAIPIRDESGRVRRWFGTNTDITNQREIEEALRESESRERARAAVLDALMEYAPIGITIADAPDVTIRMVSKHGQELTGRTGDILQNIPAEKHVERWGIYHVDGKTLAATDELPLTRAVKQGEIVRDEEWIIRRPDGTDVPIATSAGPIRDAQGSITGGVIAWSDISERKKVERAVEQLNRDLKRRVDELQVLFNVAPIGLAVAFDPACSKISVNPAGAKMIGMPTTTDASLSAIEPGRLGYQLLAEGRNLRPEELPMQTAALRNVEVRGVELEVMRSDGTTVTVLHSAAPLRDERGQVRGSVGAFLDITARRKIDEDLVRAQKLESIGLLAGGIAHDFNNILTMIFGNIELAKLYADDRPDIAEPLTQAVKAFKRARNLTQQLLTFAKGGAPMREVVSVADLLTESVGFALHGSNVLVEFAIAPDLWQAKLDVGQMSQAINNLVINAKEAMPEGGRLRVEAKNLTLDEGNNLGLHAGRNVEIRIQDWGVGIPEENFATLFDPYFTTKPHGTGLGLPTVYSIVNRHGGRISVESKVGEGTTFIVYLPATDEALPRHVERKQAARHGKGRVLLMDDEEVVQQVGKALLEKLGYVVEAVSDGKQAVECFKAAKDKGVPFSAVILDLTVPGAMGGKECLERLREIDPALKALVSSGYSNDPVMARCEAYGFQGVVPKPYDVEELSAALAKITVTESSNE